MILENGAPGGKLIKTNKISNYPGIKDIEGTQLAMDMFEQATSFQKSNMRMVKSIKSMKIKMYI